MDAIFLTLDRLVKQSRNDDVKETIKWFDLQIERARTFFRTGKIPTQYTREEILSQYFFKGNND
jgi:hypothetical protein